LVTLLRSILQWTPWYIVPQVLTVNLIVPLILFPSGLITELHEREKTLVESVIPMWRTAGKLAKLWPVALPVLTLAFFAIAVVYPCTWAILVPIKGWQQMAMLQKSIEPRYELGVWLRDHIPADSTVGMFDAGITGYFSARHVINLDGLVNSPDYLPVRRSGAYADYVVRNKINYLIYYYFPPYHMDWGHLADDSMVCHKLVHINRNSAVWGPNKAIKNYFEVIAMRYDGQCALPWKAGFPRSAFPLDSQ
jgi:hypothetical protein